MTNTVKPTPEPECSTRYNEGKIDWVKMFRLWPKALPELMKVVEYGFKEHGPYNCRLSIGTEKHAEFRENCIGSGKRHWLEDAMGNHVCHNQASIYHAAFEAWNALMKLEYTLSEIQNKPKKKKELKWKIPSALK